MNTCDTCSLDDERKTLTCKKCKPSSESTSIAVEGCFWFVNNDGELSCGGSEAELPAGSYLQHCEGCEHADGTLSCNKCRHGAEHKESVQLNLAQYKSCHWVYADQGELKCQHPFISVHMDDYKSVKFGKLSFPKNLYRLWIVSAEEPSEKLRAALEPFHGKVWSLHLTLDKNESNTSQESVLSSLHKLFKVEEDSADPPLFLLQHSSTSTNERLEVPRGSEDEMLAALVTALQAKMGGAGADASEHDEL